MHYAALASGSKGNCHALSEGGRTLLIDAGISLLQIRRRMEILGLDSGSVHAPWPSPTSTRTISARWA